MLNETIVLYINDIMFVGEVGYNPAESTPGIYHLAPEDCMPEESEPLEIITLQITVEDNGESFTHDASFLIDSLFDDIKEQLTNEF